MGSLFLVAALLFALVLPAAAQQSSPSAVNGGIYNATPPTLSDKQRGVFELDANGNLKVTSSGTPSGTQDVNLKQVGGATTATGHGTAAGALRVELPTDGTGTVGLIAGTAVIGHVITDTGSTTAVTQATAANLNATVIGAGTAGTANAGVVTVQGIASMTPVQVSQATAASLNATVVGTGTFAVQPSNPIGITPTDRTVTSATGSSQTLMALNASRRGLVAQNTGNANCGVNPTGGTAAIGGAGTLTLVPNGSYQPKIPTLSAITVICTAGQPFYAEEN